MKIKNLLIVFFTLTFSLMLVGVSAIQVSRPEVQAQTNIEKTSQPY
jgi:hypothetical protein